MAASLQPGVRSAMTSLSGGYSTPTGAFVGMPLPPAPLPVYRIPEMPHDRLFPGEGSPHLSDDVRNWHEAARSRRSVRVSSEGQSGRKLTPRRPPLMTSRT
jgi:hypothetical protein